MFGISFINARRSTAERTCMPRSVWLLPQKSESLLEIMDIYGVSLSNSSIEESVKSREEYAIHLTLSQYTNNVRDKVVYQKPTTKSVTTKFQYMYYKKQSKLGG